MSWCPWSMSTACTYILVYCTRHYLWFGLSSRAEFRKRATELHRMLQALRIRLRSGSLTALSQRKSPELFHVAMNSVSGEPSPTLRQETMAGGPTTPYSESELPLSARDVHTCNCPYVPRLCCHRYRTNGLPTYMCTVTRSTNAHFFPEQWRVAHRVVTFVRSRTKAVPETRTDHRGAASSVLLWTIHGVYNTRL